MGLFNFLKQPDINERLEIYDAMPDAVLLDVRTPQEYSEGHIPCSTNIPLQSIGDISEVTEKKTTPLFVYCRSGTRSCEAACILRKMGYRRVENIGGICAYQGNLERGGGYEC